MEAKKEVVTERLRARDEERKRLEEVRRRVDTGDLEKQIDRFMSEFASVRSRIESLLSLSAGLVSSSDLSCHFDCIGIELQSAQKLISDAQLFLPTYDKWAANNALAALQSKYGEQKEELAPKKKFAFKSRKKETVFAAGDVPDGNSVESSTRLKKQTKEMVSLVTECGFFDRSAEVLMKLANEVNGRDVSLQRLTGCTVRLQGNPSTVHASGLTDCTVLIGPVSTSVFIDGCVRVTFAVACQQLRVHSSSNCDVYVRVTSRSVIENCTGIRFGPFTWHYDGIEEHFTSSGIDGNVENWKCVDDFDWLVADTPSPNWTVLEEEQRVSFK